MNRFAAMTMAAVTLTVAGTLAAAGPAVAGSRDLAAAGRAVPGRDLTWAQPATPPGGPVPAGFKPASVTFASPQEGWVLGTAPCKHTPCTSVLRTTDGGRSWVGIPAPLYPLARFGGETGLVRLRFADPADGFAFGSQLWVTHDGGSSWYRVRQVPGSIDDLEASAGVVYAASDRSGVITIYASPAGSDSWHRVAGLPTVSGYAGLGTIALHGRAGWIVLGNRLYSSQNDASWVRDSIRCPKYYGMDSVAAYNSSSVTVLCTGNPGLGSTQKVVYASSDGGLRFSKAGLPPMGGDGGVIAEPTPAHLFVATSSGATWLYVSNDGGKRWHDGLTLDDGGLGWADFGFTTAVQGVAIEGNPTLGSHMWLTRNAGVTWRIVRF